MIRAQRRPESEPRRHSPAGAECPARSPLNEGRSLNPGDTRTRGISAPRRGSTLNEGRSLNPGDTARAPRLDTSLHNAQRRPESEPRRHAASSSPALSMQMIAQRRPESEPRRHTAVPLSSYTPGGAQRRPESEPRRHVAVTVPVPTWYSAQRRPESEPRRHEVHGVEHLEWHCAQRRPESEPRRHFRGKTGEVHSRTSAQRRPESEPRRHACRTTTGWSWSRALNEGRSLNPGDTVLLPLGERGAGAGAQRRPESEPRRHGRVGEDESRREARSTKAGV